MRMRGIDTNSNTISKDKDKVKVKDSIPRLGVSAFPGMHSKCAVRWGFSCTDRKDAVTVEAPERARVRSSQGG